MKFVKGMVMGTLISTGLIMMYKESTSIGRNKIVKKGKKWAKKMGIL